MTLLVHPSKKDKRTRHHLPQRVFLLLCCLLVGFALIACSEAGKGSNDTKKTHEIAPVFREFHSSLGGVEVLGPAISQPFEFDQYECQYTVNALMCQDPMLSGEERLILYPLGSVFEMPTTEASAPGEAEKGLTVYEEFVPLYGQFSGERFAGKPISQASINYTQQRVEQFFENIGMYRNFNDLPGTAKLLAYGAFACNQVCSYPAAIEAIILNPANTASDQPFLPALGEMKSSAVFGVPLTQPYIAEDGSLEQVYTNAILFSPADKPEKVSLRPLPELLGITPTLPVPQLHDSSDNMVFYPVKDELGFHVPTVFDTFIVAHGGRKLAGDPISETFEISPGLYRQCFTHYCLVYDPAAAPYELVTLAPLGQQYLESLKAATNKLDPPIISSETVTLEVTEQFPVLSRGTTQRIDVLATKSEDQSPLVGIRSTLTVLLPDGTTYNAEFPVTSAQGRSSLEVPDQDSVPNGTILVYEVCLNTGASEPLCAQGSYLVWKAP